MIQYPRGYFWLGVIAYAGLIGLLGAVMVAALVGLCQ